MTTMAKADPKLAANLGIGHALRADVAREAKRGCLTLRECLEEQSHEVDHPPHLGDGASQIVCRHLCNARIIGCEAVKMRPSRIPQAGESGASCLVGVKEHRPNPPGNLNGKSIDGEEEPVTHSAAPPWPPRLPGSVEPPGPWRRAGCSPASPQDAPFPQGESLPGGSDIRPCGARRMCHLFGAARVRQAGRIRRGQLGADGFGTDYSSLAYPPGPGQLGQPQPRPPTRPSGYGPHRSGRGCCRWAARRRSGASLRDRRVHRLRSLAQAGSRGFHAAAPPCASHR